MSPQRPRQQRKNSTDISRFVQKVDFAPDKSLLDFVLSSITVVLFRSSRCLPVSVVLILEFWGRLGRSPARIVLVFLCRPTSQSLRDPS